MALAEDVEIVKEFLIESNENLSKLDREIVELEQRPTDGILLGSIFRTFHTIKGSCGMLGFQNLEGVTHAAENLLSQIRNGERQLTPDLASLILQTVDAVKSELQAIEISGTESGNRHEDVLARLTATCSPKSAAGNEISASPVPNNSETNEGATSRTTAVDTTIRVDVGLLDKLMNLVGELVLTRNQILQFNAHQDEPTSHAISQRLNLITTELQEGVMKTRMQPIGVVWKKLPRLVRDLATATGKRIELTTDGEETELDKTIIEAINDPLTHLVRNCCDHGIEDPAKRADAGKAPSGTIALHAYHEGGQVNIEISDDGAGVDLNRIKEKAILKGIVPAEQADRLGERQLLNLVFLPGFSTAQQVTNVSGRGVGMDVVKTNIERIGGSIDFSSHAGSGTTVRLKIPLTLAIIPGLVVMVGSDKFIIPQVSLLELIRLEGEAANRQIEDINGALLYRRRGLMVPVVRLSDLLELPSPLAPDVVSMAVLQAEGRQFGLIVDGICDTQEIVVKPLGRELKGLSCYAGSTILGDGSVALILDVVGIAQLAHFTVERREEAGRQLEMAGQPSDDGELLLLFRAGRFSRIAAPLSLVARLEEFSRNQVEYAGGEPVVQYRGRILPIISLAAVLCPDEAATAMEAEQFPAIVFQTSDDRQVGVIIDEILDIVCAPGEIRACTHKAGLLGSAVVGGRLADFLDLHAVMDAAQLSRDEAPFETQARMM